LDAFMAYQGAASTGNFGSALTEAFGPTVASTSFAQVCIDRACAGPVKPPGPFNTGVPFPQNAFNGAFTFDDTYTAHFGAGSPVGAYIVFYFPALPFPIVTNAISAGAYGGFTAIAPGTWIEIYGSNLGVGTRFWGTNDFMGASAPVTLGGTTVTGRRPTAFIDYVSSGQVNAQVPSTWGRARSRCWCHLGLELVLLTRLTQYLLALFPLFPDGMTYVLPPGAISGITSRPAIRCL
jgi:hypothetical protein